MEIIQLGSMYFDGMPFSLGSAYNGGRINIFLSPVTDMTITPTLECPWYCRQEDGTTIIDRSSVIISKGSL